MKILILTLVTITCISACDKPKTVTYYENHPKEMEAKLKECNDDQTKFVKDGNCINARKAKGNIFRDNFFKNVKVNKSNPAPPVNLFEGK